ncbi:MAG: carboxypeptidase-like regulatory domain-containing protein [Halobacteriales archaeon]|nr:carboxypeptidase-like regulatory domain-containing protein [Halobacteriales archaeon]
MTSRTPRRLLFTSLIVVLASVLGACQFLNPPPPGTIEGSVVNRKGGTAVQGTTVRLVELDRVATTDANGSYALKAPIGTWTLEFTQAGYAMSRVEGVRVRGGDQVRQDVIQAQAFDPAVPADAPTLTLSVDDGDVVEGDATTDLFTFDIGISVADSDLLQPYFVTAGLGQSRGTSGYLNRFVPGAVVGLGETSVTAELSADGFEGETTLHVVAYDTNFNRTERIVHLTVSSSRTGAPPTAPAGLTGNAITFGDVGVFGALGISSSVTGRQIEATLGLDDVSEIDLGREVLPTAFEEIQPDAGIGAQSYLDEVVTWVDLYFSYTFASGADLPTAFEVYRTLGSGNEVLIGRVSPFQAYLTGSTFGFRDATPALQAGVEATYRVDAVTGAARASSGTFATTPLGAFEVTADAPANGEDFTSVLPTYDMSYSGIADDVFLGVLVFDRVHAEGNFLEWGAVGINLAADGALPGLTVTSSGASIPHNIDGSASTDTLQAFHAYDWTPIAVTHTSDFSAISVAADFYDFFGIGFGVSDGPWNTFLTGDGSF